MTDPAAAPLIYTKHGNVEAHTLARHVEWSFVRDDAGNVTSIKCRVFYTNAAGDVVKDGADVYITQGVGAMAEAAIF